MASFKSAVFAAMCFGSNPMPCPYPPPPPPTIADVFDAMAEAIEPKTSTSTIVTQVYGPSYSPNVIYCNNIPCSSTFHDSAPDAADIYRAIAKVFREHGDPR